MMKKHIVFAYIFGLILSGLSVPGFIYKLILIIYEYPAYPDYLQIAAALGPALGLALTGLIILSVAQTMRIRQQDKDQMRRILEQEKLRRD
jgi:hypothetical protein